MNKIIKRMVTLSLATVMIISGSLIAFAYSSSYGSAPLGEGSMDFTVNVNGESAYAGIGTSDTSDSKVEGIAYYRFPEDTRWLYAAADQSAGCGARVVQSACEFYYFQ